MQTKSWALATALVLSLSGVSAEKPRIYFPRQVQRQFDNVTSSAEPTTTRGGLLDPILDPSLSDGDSTATEDATQTDNEDDGILIGPTGIINLPGLIGDETTSSTPTRSPTVAKTTSDVADETTSDDKTSVTKTADNSDSTKEESESEKTAEPTSTTDGLLDPILDPILGDESTTQSSATESEESSGTASAEPTATATATATGDEDEVTEVPSSTQGGLLDPVETLISDIAGPGDSSTTVDPSTNATEPTQPGGDEISEATEVPTQLPATTQDGLLDPVETLISDIVGPGSSTSSAPVVSETDNVSQPSSTGDDVVSEILPSLTLFPPEPTTSAPVVSEIDTVSQPSSTGDDVVSEILPSLTLFPPEPTTSAPSVSEIDTVSQPSSTGDDVVSEILPSLTLFPPEPTATDSVATDSASVSEEPNATTTGTLVPTDVTLPVPGDGTTSTASGEPTVPTDLPGNGTVTDLPPSTDVPTDISTDEPTAEPSAEPTNIPDESTLEPPPIGNATQTTVELPPSAPGSSLPTLVPTTDVDEETPASTPASLEPVQPTEKPTTSVVEEEPTASVIPTATEVKDPVTSIQPTATFTNTNDWLPTTIVADPTTFIYTRPTEEPTGTSTKTLPNNIPKKILPNNPVEEAPDGTVLINIGFKYPLNYNHVAKNTVAAAQIFQLLPSALSTAGKVKSDKVYVSMLVPYDTRDKWGFVTTLAKVYYPESLLDQLRMDIDDPNSLVYNTDKVVVNELTADIEPRIDFFGNMTGDDDEDSQTQQTGSNSDDDDSNNNTIDSGDNNTSTGSSKDQATTAGIAVGAFGLAALYGGAMFIVARRYKRKRQGHRRTSSVTGSDASSDMQYTRNGSPAMMGGALMSQDMSHYGAAGQRERDSHGSGPSARTANISAPVATENSLGWN
ncbi:Signaling mucin-like protein [Emericellopsis cladophorae]|uniref:Signaling mucin-like protein n=1 Tax=Emericellopsis cladophorae TaxID=2686198 RepID=A0A9P9XWT4_9HYPO|nr:Signaling mucin-like protein [Emericellopsis cladophorae]KAI6778998.1 Signaling mucin-like protein [Emericellopsis cladophorae]